MNYATANHHYYQGACRDCGEKPPSYYRSRYFAVSVVLLLIAIGLLLGVQRLFPTLVPHTLWTAALWGGFAGLIGSQIQTSCHNRFNRYHGIRVRFK